MSMVSAKLNQGIDSFVRISNFLRRKEIYIKSINFEAQDRDDVKVNIQFKDESSLDSILNYISKLQDVYEVRVLP